MIVFSIILLAVILAVSFVCLLLSYPAPKKKHDQDHNGSAKISAFSTKVEKTGEVIRDDMEAAIGLVE